MENSKIYIGIDNGVTGTIGFVNLPIGDVQRDYDCIITPVKKEQSYTKAKNFISRIDGEALEDELKRHLVADTGHALYSNSFAVIERPMVNPGRFKATMSALRSLEATLVILEHFHIPRMYIDSREWQKALLPSGCEGEELKKASMDIGSRLFPECATLFTKHKDADGMLIAEYAKRKGF